MKSSVEKPCQEGHPPPSTVHTLGATLSRLLSRVPLYCTIPPSSPVSCARVQVSVAVKWSSVALLAGGGGDGGGQTDDVGGGGHSRTSSASLSSGGGSMSSSPDFDAAERLRGASGASWKGGLGTAGVGVKRKCLPIHLGRLSLSAEAGVEGAARAMEVTQRLPSSMGFVTRVALCLGSLVQVYP